jgi:hypothetical protein
MIGVFAGVDAVGFADDQCFGPRTRIAFSFQRFDQAQKAVFEFECLVIENFEIVLGKLVCLEVSVVAGNTLSERAQGDIKVLDVFSDRSATITLSDIPVDGVGRSDRLSPNPLHFERLRLKQPAGLDVQCNRILPNPQLLIPPILVLSLHYSITPILQHSITPSLDSSSSRKMLK